jgi:O-antigen/teichoic acid export membrane protein
VSGRRARPGSGLVRSSAAIIATTLINSALGFAFWIVAARRFPEGDVGVAAAIVAGLTLISVVTTFGITFTMVETLVDIRDAGTWSAVTTAGALIGGGLAALAAFVAGSLAPLWSSRFDLLWQPSGIAMFALGAGLTTAGSAIDAAFLSRRRGSEMLSRNICFGALKLSALALAPLVLLRHGSTTVLGAWVVSAAASMVISAAWHLPRVQPGFRLRLRGGIGRVAGLWRRFAGHHLVTVGGLLPQFLLPSIVLARLGASDNAHFALTWSAGSVFFIISPAVAAALFVEGSSSALPHHLTGRCLATTLGILAPVIGLSWVLAGPVLSLFGPGYARAGTPLLRILAISTVPDAVTNIRVASWRLRGSFGPAVSLNLAMAFGTVALSWLVLPSTGIVGAGWAWLGAQSLGAVVVAGLALLGWRHRRAAVAPQ